MIFFQGLLYLIFFLAALALTGWLFGGSIDWFSNGLKDKTKQDK